MSKKQDVKNLKKYKEDLTDDKGEITSINKYKDELQEDFSKFISSDNIKPIINKMDDLREQYETSDSSIISAVSYIDKEIRALEKEIAAEKAAKRAADEARKAITGE